MPEPGGIPAEDGIGLPTVQTPAELAGERQPRPPLSRTARPAERRHPTVELCLNVRPEVEGEADIVATARDLIGDLDGPAAPVQPHRPVVPGPRAAASRTRRVRRSS